MVVHGSERALFRPATNIQSGRQSPSDVSALPALRLWGVPVHRGEGGRRTCGVNGPETPTTFVGHAASAMGDAANEPIPRYDARRLRTSLWPE